MRIAQSQSFGFVVIEERIMNFSEIQIDGAFQNARLHGYKCPNRDVAVQFLDWYHANREPAETVLEGIRVGLSGPSNGMEEQIKFWQQYGSK